MNKLYLLVLFACLSLPLAHAQAQCTYTPAVTPNNLLMCPDTQDTIRTQAYDTYQWYKDGVLLPGATKRYYVVDYSLDSGSKFKVAVSLNGCAKTSSDVLVDGRAYAGISVSAQAGATGYAFDAMNNLVLCDSTRLFSRDTVYFKVLLPYDTNVKWYKDGVAIKNATATTLAVSQTGSYEVEGAPSTCPNFSQRSFPIPVIVRSPDKPLVSQVGAKLVATPPLGRKLKKYQWYFNGTALAGDTVATCTPSAPGTYWVRAEEQFCHTISNLFRFARPLGVHLSELAGKTTIYPNPGQSVLHVAAPAKVTTTVYNLTGQLVLQSREATLDISRLREGLYLVQLSGADGNIIKVEKLLKTN